MDILRGMLRIFLTACMQLLAVFYSPPPAATTNVMLTRVFNGEPAIACKSSSNVMNKLLHDKNCARDRKGKPPPSLSAPPGLPCSAQAISSSWPSLFNPSRPLLLRPTLTSSSLTGADLKELVQWSFDHLDTNYDRHINEDELNVNRIPLLARLVTAIIQCLEGLTLLSLYLSVLSLNELLQSFLSLIDLFYVTDFETGPVSEASLSTNAGSRQLQPIVSSGLYPSLVEDDLYIA